ncbi:MAG: PadR family transcriptional regulator [Candidatus Thorarchaeota archaeon]|nr:PadR family transcriptional regulator [Candidatus Thorarchaeota archaeon]
MNDEAQQKDCEHLEMPQSVPRGLLRHIIPRLLTSRDMTGTEIMHALHDLTEGEWNPGPGTIYPMLSSMEESGIIKTVKTEGRSKTYSLTEEGRERMVMIIKKKTVGHKTRLGPRIWEKLLGPSERVQFHIHGTDLAMDSLENIADSLKTKDRQKLLKHLEEMNDRISSLIDTLKSGGT